MLILLTLQEILHLHYHKIMRSTTVIIGIILVGVNLLLGYLLSGYQEFNIWFNTIVIVETMIFALLAQLMRGGFRTSLSILYTFALLPELVIGSLSPAGFVDNWAVITYIVLLLIKVVFLVLGFRTSRM